MTDLDWKRLALALEPAMMWQVKCMTWYGLEVPEPCSRLRAAQIVGDRLRRMSR